MRVAKWYDWDEEESDDKNEERKTTNEKPKKGILRKEKDDKPVGKRTRQAKNVKIAENLYSQEIGNNEFAKRRRKR